MPPERRGPAAGRLRRRWPPWTAVIARTPASWSAQRPSQNTCTPSSIAAGSGEEALLVEPRLGVGLDQLVGRVGGVLVLDLVVPGPEGEGQPLALTGLERLEPGDELLPEPGRGPVLDGVAGALGQRGVLGAVDLEQLVAEEQGRRRCRGDACRGRRSRGPAGAAKRSEPLEVGGAEAEAAAVDGAVGGDELGIGVGRGERWPVRPALNTTPSSLRRISLPAR